MGKFASLEFTGFGVFGEKLGYSVTSIGDVNGDGVEDIAVSAASDNAYGGEAGNGRVFVVFGDKDGFDQTIDLRSLGQDEGFQILPDYNLSSQFGVNARFGYDVKGLGDVNGDGIADFGIVQQATETTGGGYYGEYGYGGDTVGQKGAAYVIYGGQTFVEGDSTTTASVNVNTLGGFRIDAEGSVESIEAVGDVNGDGINDVAINTTNFDFDNTQTVTAVTNVDSNQDGTYDASTEPSASQDVEVAFGESRAFVVYGTNQTRTSDTPIAGSGAPVDALQAVAPDADQSAPQAVVNTTQMPVSEGVSVKTGDALAVLSVGTPEFTNVDGDNPFENRYFNLPGNLLLSDYQSGEYKGGVLFAAGDLNGDGKADLAIGYGSAPDTDTVFEYEVSGNTTSYNHVSGINGLSTILGASFSTSELNLAVVTDKSFRDVAAYDPKWFTALGNTNGDATTNSFAARFYGSIAPTADGSGLIQGTGIALVEDYSAVTTGTLASQQVAVFYNGEDVALGRAYYPTNVYAVGDVNGDGLQDFALLTQDHNDPAQSQDDSLSLFVVFGKSGGFSGYIDYTQLPANGGGYRITATNTDRIYEQLRNADITSAGDLNNDGFDDILVGARDGQRPAGSGNYTYTADGETYVIFGGSEALEAADNADGSDDNVIDTGNLAVDVDTGVVPISISLQGAYYGLVKGEGDSGTTNFTFTVTRTGDLDAAVSVDFNVGVSAGAGQADATDFVGGVLPSGRLTFAQGEATATITVPVQGDTTIENTEVFEVQISNATTDNNAPITIFGDSALGRIANDDLPVYLTVSNAKVQEGDTGDSNVLEFFVTRTGDVNSAVDVDYSLEPGASGGYGGANSADSSDVVGTLPRSGSVRFEAGETTKKVSVAVVGDDVDEAREYMIMRLTGATSSNEVRILDGFGLGQILNDDFPPRIRIEVDRISLLEGNSGTTPVTFTFIREGDDDGEATITYDLRPAGRLGLRADSADFGSDFPVQGAQVTFADGETHKQVTVLVNGDTVIEPREGFAIEITDVEWGNGNYQVLSRSQTVQIINDDGRPDIPVVVIDGEEVRLEADVFGDPHITTLDGLGYDFQAVGEYILVETEDGATNPFQVQVRFEPFNGSDLVSVTTRMAVKIDGVTIEVDAKGADPLLINGVAPTADALAQGFLDVNGDGTPDVFVDGPGMFTIVLNAAGEQLKVGNFGGALNVCVFLGDPANGGNGGAVRGLMGNANQQIGDDFALRDGSDIPASELTTDDNGVPSLSFDFLYGRGDFAGVGYADSWRLDGTDGKAPAFTGTTPSFADGFPTASFKLSDLPQEVVAAAIAAAEAAGLSASDNQALFDAAVLDFALTGDDSFFDARRVLVAEPDATSAPTDAPEVGATVGVTAAQMSVVEGDEGQTTELAFTFYRAGSSEGTVALNYAVSGVTGDDLVGGAGQLTGSVSFADGETTKVVVLTVAGDLQTEADEDLTVRIDSVTEGSALIGAVQAITTIENDDAAPVAADDQFSVLQDAALSGDVQDANGGDTDSDADGDQLSILSLRASTGAALSFVAGTAIALPSGASLTMQADGKFTYQQLGAFAELADGQIGQDSFSYTLSDGNGGEDEATVVISVVGINDAPTADNDTADVDEDGSVTIDVLDNDSDIDGDAISISEVGAASNGSVEIVDGKIVYTPKANFNGVDQFTYTITDQGLTDTATVEVTVNAVNDGPVAENDTATVEEDGSVTIDVLDNDSDIDGDALGISDIGTASNGTVEIVGGKIVYTPKANFSGVDQFTYTITDEELTDTATVSVTVSGVNDGPVAANDTATTKADTVLTDIDLLGNDSDADDDALTVTAVNADGVPGTVTLNDDGTVDYDPNGAFAGLLIGETAEVTFTYTVSDGGAQDQGSVTITIEGTAEPVVTKEVIMGTDGYDRLIGTDADEILISKGGIMDRLFGGGGADEFNFVGEFGDGSRSTDIIADFNSDEDSIVLGTSDYSVQIFGDRFAMIRSTPKDEAILVFGDFESEQDLNISVTDANIGVTDTLGLL